MTRAFFDTHVAYWLASETDRISRSLLARINTHHERAVSSLSFAELEIKNLIGRTPRFDTLRERFDVMSITIEPFDYEASRSLSRFGSLVGHDPFDRMILAHAAARPNTTLYTADARLVELDLDWIVDARA